MKKFKITMAAVLAVLFVMPLFNGCKKGESDPFLTLKSRKSRLVGEWDVTKDKIVSVYGSTTVNESFDGGTYTYTAGTTSVTGTYTWTITVDKKGTWTAKQSITCAGATQSTDYEGIWYFVDGNKDSDVKDGERVAFEITKETQVDASGTTITSFVNCNYTIYLLKELKSKEIIMTGDYTVTSSSTQTVTEEMTLTGK
ncbi:MAG: hypothetical protein PHD97_03890 [Bacteroidales bacterium]|nr:hypothetical protein [Bacteroidales bacterium]